MYLLEYRDKTIPLAYGGEFTVPENVYLIGTMNTADRSIALVDHAFRRRFSFIYLAPDYGVLRRYLEEYELPADSLISVLKLINTAIDDPHYEVGISFFLKDGVRLKETLQDVWHGEIEPYLEEYFYDRPEKIEPFRWERLIEADLADWAP
jgi:5-methylcytosine-specific restriction protein B